MSDAVSSADRWQRWRSACVAAFANALPDAECAAGLTAGLLVLFPGATAVACRLPGGAASTAAPHGHPPEAPGLVSHTDGATTPIRFGPGDGLAAPFADGVGVLVVAPPPSPADLARAAAVLELGPALAEAATERRRLAAEHADISTFATLGIAADGIAHEFNNVLNTMTLQAAVVKMKAAPDLKDAVEAIRKQGLLAAGLLKPMQQFRAKRRDSMTPTDLNTSVASVLAGHPDWHVATQYASGLPHVRLSYYEWGRLVRYTVAAAARRSAGRPVTVRTGPGPDGRVRLTVADAGGPADPHALAQPFEPGGILTGEDEFESLAVQSVIRQHQASLEAVAGPVGVEVHIDFRAG